MWIDLVAGRYVIVLSNRGHPTSIAALYAGAIRSRVQVAEAALTAAALP